MYSVFFIHIFVTVSVIFSSPKNADPYAWIRVWMINFYSLWLKNRKIWLALSVCCNTSMIVVFYTVKNCSINIEICSFFTRVLVQTMWDKNLMIDRLLSTVLLGIQNTLVSWYKMNVGTFFTPRQQVGSKKCILTMTWKSENCNHDKGQVNTIMFLLARGEIQGSIVWFI